MESEKKAHDVVVIIGRGRLVNWLVGRLVATIYFPCGVVRGDELERNPEAHYRFKCALKRLATILNKLAKQSALGDTCDGFDWSEKITAFPAPAFETLY